VGSFKNKKWNGIKKRQQKANLTSLLHVSALIKQLFALKNPFFRKESTKSAKKSPRRLQKSPKVSEQ
jgi:hypothetical protein